MRLHDVLAKVISGGQTGADEAGVETARLMHIDTGGTMPRGWTTQVGPRPDFAHLYNMVEHKSSSYGPRTFTNVHDADITIRIAVDLSSPGELLTAKACRQIRRPIADVLLLDQHNIFVQASPDSHATVGRYSFRLDTVRNVADTIIALATHELGRPVVVNIAGNSDKTAPGIHQTAMDVCRRIFLACVR